MLKLEHVSKYYHNRGVTTKGLDDISVEFNKGEVVAITGESGSGKSTLLNVISRLDTFDDGEIYFKGNETSYFNVLDMDQFRKNKISFIFQNYNIIESYTVLENVMVPLMINGINKKEARKKALEILDKVGLKSRANNRGTQLSGGEKQRTVIARALALDTPIIACDEPTGNLDQKTGREIMELICELSKDKLVLIVTHNFDEISDLATRKIKIHDGKIVEDLTFKNFKEDPKEELELDYKPISKKTDFNIALNNLISTPKKTIFTFLVFIVIAFFSLNIFQVVMNNTTSNSYPLFSYSNPNKYLVYDANYNTLDINELKKAGDVVTNAFYEQTIISLSNKDDTYSNLYSTYETYVEGELKYGNKPENDNEFVVFLPTNSTYTYSVGDTFIINSKYKISANNGEFISDKAITETKFVLSGIGYTDYANRPLVTMCKKLEEYALFSALIDNLELESSSLESIKDINYPIFFNFDEKTRIVNYNETSDQSALNLNVKYYKYNLFNTSSLEKDASEDTRYRAYDNDTLSTASNALVIGYDIGDKISEVYEASVYVENKNKLKDFDNLGYSYYQSTISNSDDIIDDLSLYASLILGVPLCIILYFISYIILRKIYESKSETYTIFRTLGVTVSDMKKISLIEILILSVSSTVLLYVVMTILGKIFKYKEYLKLFSHIAFSTTCIYFVLTILMAILIAIKFNKKLFKKSVKESLKEAK